jgi:hypothetical protein
MAEEIKNETTEVKLTETEIKLATELETKRRNLQQEAASIKLLELQIELRQDNLEQFYTETLELEKQVSETLSNKYGNGSIDIEKGVFIPA